jgi:two-component system, chemotaxis family, chemotaxis protein CheY
MSEEHTHTALLIDDDQFLLDMYSIKFKESGINVITSTAAEDGLDKLRDGLKPDIILFDMIMPAMNGTAFLEQLKEEELAKDAVLIVLSNQSDTAGIKEVKKLGADGYILKADTVPSDVLKQVTDVLKKHKKK